MIKKTLKWIICIGIYVLILSYLSVYYQALFFKKYTIEKIINLAIPKSAEIIDYKIGMGSSVDIDPFYAKLEIDSNTYNMWGGNDSQVLESEKNMTEDIKKKFSHDSLMIENAEEIWISDIMTSKYSFFLAGSTRVIYVILTKESIDKYYLYVMY